MIKTHKLFGNEINLQQKSNKNCIMLSIVGEGFIFVFRIRSTSQQRKKLLGT